MYQSKQNSNEILKMWVNGETFTNLVLSLWKSNLVENALVLLENLPDNVKKDILEERAVLVGDTRTKNKELTVKYKNRPSKTVLTVEKQRELLEKKFIENLSDIETFKRNKKIYCGEFNNIAGLPTSKANEYKQLHGKELDAIIEEKELEFKCTVKNLSALYKFLNLNIIDFPLNKLLIQYSQLEIDNITDAYDKLDKCNDDWYKIIYEGFDPEKNNKLSEINKEVNKCMKEKTTTQNENLEKSKVIPTSKRPIPIDINKQNDISNAWISPKGLVFECEAYEHIPLADDLVEYEIVQIPKNYQDTIDFYLEETGWLKLSNNRFTTFHSLTQDQIDVINDYMILKKVNKISDGLNSYSLQEFIERHNN